MTQNQYLPEQILIPFFGKDSNIVGIEIGTLGASGTAAMLNRMPNLKLYTIDPWLHSDTRGFEAERSQEWHDEMYLNSVNRLKEFRNRCVVIRKKSDDAINDVPDKVDFVWVDGDHSKDQVERDIINWLPKIKSHGIFGGHDSQIDYILQFAKKYLGEVLLGEDFTWWREFNENIKTDI